MSDQPITPLTPAQATKADGNVDHEGYLKREAVALDIFADETLDSQPDETISSRMARWAFTKNGVKGFIGRTVSRGLNLFQKDHGAQAVEGDKRRAENIIETENNSGIVPK